MKSKTIILTLFLIYITSQIEKKKKFFDFSRTEISGLEIIDFVKNLDYQLDQITINVTQFEAIFKLDRITELNGKTKILNITKDDTISSNKSVIKNDEGKIVGQKFSYSVSSIYFSYYLLTIKRDNLLPNVKIIDFRKKKTKN